MQSSRNQKVLKDLRVKGTEARQPQVSGPHSTNANPFPNKLKEEQQQKPLQTPKPGIRNLYSI